MVDRTELASGDAEIYMGVAVQLGTKQFRLSGVAILCTIGTIVAGTPALAAADPLPTGADSVATQIAEVAPNQGRVLQTSVRNGSATVRAGGDVVDVPVDPERALTVSTGADQGEQRSSATELEVSLPRELDLTTASVAGDGTVVYKAARGGSSAAVQILDGGSTRVQTLIPDAGAERTFTYSFGPESRVLHSTDGRIVVEHEGQFVAEIAAPWAKDADGKAVPTHYVLGEGTITQVVETTSNTAFPVVADPTFITGSNIWFGGAFVAARFTIGETVRIAQGGGVTGAVGTLVGMVPTPQTVIAGNVLKGIGAAAVVWAGGARVLNKCVEIRYYISNQDVYGLYYSGAANGCY